MASFSSKFSIVKLLLDKQLNSFRNSYFTVFTFSNLGEQYSSENGKCMGGEKADWLIHSSF